MKIVLRYDDTPLGIAAFTLAHCVDMLSDGESAIVLRKASSVKVTLRENGATQTFAGADALEFIKTYFQELSRDEPVAPAPAHVPTVMNVTGPRSTEPVDHASKKPVSSLAMLAEEMARDRERSFQRV